MKRPLPAAFLLALLCASCSGARQDEPMQLEYVISYFSNTNTVEISSVFSTISKAEVPAEYKDVYLEVNDRRTTRSEHLRVSSMKAVHSGYRFEAVLEEHPAGLAFVLGGLPGEAYRLKVLSNAFSIKGLPDRLVERDDLVVTYEGPDFQSGDTLSLWAGNKGALKPLGQVAPGLAGQLVIPKAVVSRLPKGELEIHFIRMTHRSFVDGGITIHVSNAYSSRNLSTRMD